MTTRLATPRLAFVGAGWIGRNRMRSLIEAGGARVACVIDLDPAAAHRAAAEVGCDLSGSSLSDALAQRPDGIVIATPNALHAEQALAALHAGIPVFCQKPLGRSTPEASSVVEAARRNDLCLGVDMSYRHVDAFARARSALRSSIDRPYAAELWFHNAYGPDKPWFQDPASAGGGCALDLATHLIDLAFWFSGRTDRPEVSATLFRGGRPLRDPSTEVEDHALIGLHYDDADVRIACSWFVSAGVDARIGATFYGPEDAVAIENVGGSYFDFRAEHRRGRTATVLSEPPDDWGGRALQAWVDRVARGEGFDPAIEDVVRVAEVLDLVYGRTR